MSKAKSSLSKIKVKKKKLKTAMTEVALLINLLGVVFLSLF